MHKPRDFLRRITLILCASLSACGGGGGGDDAGGLAPAPDTAPGGLYVGYYAENATDNPEDPMLGAFVLNLPAGNGDFSGSMFFTYVGCQSSNVGTVSGHKAALALDGSWTGTVDGLAQAGSYTGSYSSTLGSYSGTYTNAAGKQHRDLRPCIEYDIAAFGAWEMFPVEANVPATFDVSMNGRVVSWTNVPDAALAMAYLLDPAIAQGSGNPVIWQGLGAGNASISVPTSVALVSGRPYVLAVGVADAANSRRAFGSRRFTAP